MRHRFFPPRSYRRRTLRESGGDTVEYIIVILAVVAIGGGLMGFGNQVSGQVSKTGNSISSWFGKANGAGDNAFITYRWFKCAGLGNGAALVAKELGSSPSLSLTGLQGSCINCEVTLTVNGKSKTFLPKAICNGKVSDGIYVRPRIG